MNGNKLSITTECLIVRCVSDPCGHSGIGDHVHVCPACFCLLPQWSGFQQWPPVHNCIWMFRHNHPPWLCSWHVHSEWSFTSRIISLNDQCLLTFIPTLISLETGMMIMKITLVPCNRVVFLFNKVVILVLRLSKTQFLKKVENASDLYF